MEGYWGKRMNVCLLGSTDIMGRDAHTADIMGRDAHTAMAAIREYAAGGPFTPVLDAHPVMMTRCAIDASDEAHF